MSPGGVTTGESAMRAAAATLVLTRAARAYMHGKRRPAAETVAAALVQIERENKRHQMKSDVNRLAGQWRLVLVADSRAQLPFLRANYFPIRAHQTFTLDSDNSHQGNFNNGVFALGSSMRFSGPFRWVHNRNRLEFTFNTLKINLGPLKWQQDHIDKEGDSLEGRTAKTLPFFTFYLVRSDIAAARGREGGVALYAKVPAGEEV